MRLRKVGKPKKTLKSTPWSQQKFLGKGIPKAKKSHVYRRTRRRLKGEPAVHSFVFNGRVVVEKIVSYTFIKKGKRCGWPKAMRLLSSKPKLAMHLQWQRL